MEVMGWKSVAPDLTSWRDRKTLWLPGAVLEAHDVNSNNRTGCPGRRGDGFSVALGFAGAAQANGPTITVVRVAYNEVDVLGGDTEKVRVRRLRVLDILDVSKMIRDGKFAGANLDEANLNRANLYGANLDRANLYGANLDRANLDRANLYEANLCEANLDGASLNGANLDRANLCEANLCEANLDGASLNGANLDGANLDRANLDRANLDRANLDRANLGDWKRGDDGYAVRA
jgi:hypothetical protein